DAALLVILGDRVDPALARRAQIVAADLDAMRREGIAFGRPVPAHASVLVPFDPAEIDAERAAAIVRTRLTDGGGRVDDDPAIDAARLEPTIEIGVRYGGPDDPDLASVAAAHDLRPADVIELHANATYRVLFLGFAPGFAYIGGLPPALATPRRPTPRERVPAGSVGIAGEQTAVYPLAMPGGWQLIGRTEARLFDADRPEPALLRPGASVRFVPLR
ncbi:MAG: inhibitor of KinA, partial [Chloroflexota bacterium]|nr:inhibitor of KinA [Chloroflexota bacterium]